LQLHYIFLPLIFLIAINFITTRTSTTVLRPFVRDYPGEPVPEEDSPTHHFDHHPVFINFFHLPRSIASSLFKLLAWQFFAQPLSMSSLVFLSVWSPPPLIPYISSPNRCLLFAAKGIIRSPITSCSTRDHSIAAMFAENGIGREEGDGSAQRGQSIIYDCLVFHCFVSCTEIV